MEIDFLLAADPELTRRFAHEGDYIENGLLYCGFCRTPRQYFAPQPGGVRLVPIPCLCEREAREREQKARALAQKAERARELVFGDDVGLLRYTFSADNGRNPKLARAAKGFTEGFEEFEPSGSGLLLCGTSGRGKTFFACAIVNALTSRGIWCRFHNVADLASKLPSVADEEIEDFRRFRCIVLDDLGAERKTEAARETVYKAVDKVIRLGIPLIVTSNLMWENFKNPADIADRRVRDRIIEKCRKVEITDDDCPDVRRVIAAEQHGWAKEILGM